MVGLENVPVCTVKLIAFALAFKQAVGRVRLRRISAINQGVFGVTLLTVILLLNFLSFLPSMVLGPIGEALAVAG